MCTADCKCQKHSPIFNLRVTEYRTEMMDGQHYLVVPVIMARNDVVMNGALLPAEEMFPDAWNGVPVTLGHPSVDGESFLSANQPKVIEEWCVGRIFNSVVVDGVLKGEAWVQVDKARKIDPKILQHIKDQPLDVSTGYFADAEPVTGDLNGREYSAIHRNVRPDHLALLPGEVGACSWGDGCGVRTNRRSKMKKEARTAFANLAKALGFKFSDDADEDEKKMDNAEEDPKDKDKAKADPKEDDNEEKKEPAMNAADIVKAINEAVASAVANAVKDLKPSLSAQDQASIAFANSMVANHRKSLVDKIVANSDMKAEALANMDITVLETIANGLRTAAPVADFSGRFIGEAVANSADDPEVADMSGSGVINLLSKRNKKDAA